jgi:hypothetical protein
MGVSPKLHVLEDHLFNQLSTFKGLDDYSEDFVEQAHQVGMCEESQTFTIRDRNCIAEIHCHNEHKRSLPAVKKIQAAVAAQVSRKCSQPQNLNARQYQKVERGEKQTETLSK